MSRFRLEFSDPDTGGRQRNQTHMYLTEYAATGQKSAVAAYSIWEGNMCCAFCGPGRPGDVMGR